MTAPDRRARTSHTGAHPEHGFCVATRNPRARAGARLLRRIALATTVATRRASEQRALFARSRRTFVLDVDDPLLCSKRRPLVLQVRVAAGALAGAARTRARATASSAAMRRTAGVLAEPSAVRRDPVAGDEPLRALE